MKYKRQFKSRKGNALIEFALSAPLLFTVLGGSFQFGYVFYVYNQLQLSVRSGVRYASVMDYAGTSAGCRAVTEDMAKNVVVYGTPTPAGDARPIVPGLSTSNVSVGFNPDAKGVPTDVTMTITGFSVNALFTTFNFTGKPWATVPYVGRFAKDCE